MSIQWDQGKIVQFTPEGIFSTHKSSGGKSELEYQRAIECGSQPSHQAVYVGKVAGEHYWFLDGDDNFAAIIAAPRKALMLDKDFSVAEQIIIKKICGYIHFHHSFLRAHTTMAPEGKYRLYDNKTMIFPRIDPAIIVLIKNAQNNTILVTKNARGAESHLYSPLAGFVEVGETFEEAIEREVQEEINRKVTQITYHSSQSWPCPQSLMLGFTAVAEDDSADFVFPDREIVAAKWLSREDVRQIRALEKADIIIPEPTTVAGKMITDWLKEDTCAG